MGIFDPLLDIIFPKFCTGCGKFGTYLCRDCAKTIHLLSLPLCPGCMGSINEVGVHTRCRKETHLDGLVATASFEGVIKQMIAEAKYQGCFDLYHTLIHLFPLKTVKRLGPNLLCAVPMHPKKLQEREFNQSWILAKNLGKLLQIPATVQLLHKIKNTPSQAELKRQERLTNLEGAFSCAGRLKRSHTVLLVDDVVTTGATFSACAKALKKAGCGKVFGIALAHGH